MGDFNDRAEALKKRMAAAEAESEAIKREADSILDQALDEAFTADGGAEAASRPLKRGERAKLTKDNNGFGVAGDVVTVLADDGGTVYARFDRKIQNDTDWYVPRTALAILTGSGDAGTAGFTVPHGLDDEDAPIRYEDGKFIARAASFVQPVAPATSGRNPAIVCKMLGSQPCPAPRPFVHPDSDTASAEADRLAKANPGTKFAVYEYKRAAKIDVPYEREWQRLAANGNREEAIETVLRATGIGKKYATKAVKDWCRSNGLPFNVAA